MKNHHLSALRIVRGVLIAAVALNVGNRLAAQSASAAAESDGNEIVELDPFVVDTERGTRGYASSNALGGTRINTALADTPQSVVSLNQEFLKDIAPTNFADALKFVSGISKTAGEYNGLVSIRGVETSAIGVRDGIGDDLQAAHHVTLPDPIEVERFEVIKGPAGVLYGSHAFGGVINRVSKRPLEAAQLEIGGDYTFYDDSEAFYRATVDATGPIDADKKWRYRLLGAYQDGKNHTHGTFGRKTLVGHLEFNPTASTKLWARIRQSKDDIFSAQDLFTDSARNMPFGYVPKYQWSGNFYGNDQVDWGDVSAYEAGLTSSFNFLGARWYARVLGRYNDVSGQRRTYIASGGLFYKDGGPLVVGTKTLTTANATWTEAAAAGYDDIRENILRRDIRNGESTSWSLNFDVTTTLTLGATKHRLLIYAGTNEGEDQQHRFRENWIAPKPSIYVRTSIPPEQVLNGNPQTLANEWTTTQTWRDNFAIQDNISLLDNRLILVGAYRYDSGTTDVFDNRLNLDLPNESSSNWTPSYGIVGKPAKGVSLFYNHSETFQPQGGVNQAGDRLRPLIGDNDEVGVKLELMENRVVLTGSHFNMQQENAFLKVIYPDGSFDFTQVPSSETKGWELDLAAQPTGNLTLLIAYQWIEATTQNGLQVRNVPQGSTYKGVVKYSLPQNVLWGIGLGLTYEHINDSRAGDSANRFFLPGYDLWGMFAVYQGEHWRFQLNAENLTNEWYVAGTAAQQFMRSGAPRYFKFSVGYGF